MNRLALAFASLALLATAACGSDADGDAPLASIKAEVNVDLDTDPGELDALLLWERSAGPEDLIVSDRTNVSGAFPASFRLDVTEAPPEEILNDYTRGGAEPDETRIGIAYIAALPAGFEFDPESEVVPEFGGLAERYMLLYAESDTVSGSWSDQAFGGPLDAGFHLMQVIDVDDPSCADEVFDCLVPAAAGFDTTVEVQVLEDVDAVDAPNWT